MFRQSFSLASRCAALVHLVLKQRPTPIPLRPPPLKTLPSRPAAAAAAAAAAPPPAFSSLHTHLPASSIIKPKTPPFRPWASAAAARHLASSSSPSTTIIAFPLAQTGEGISECELIQWFVKEGDVVAEFDKVCEVQSDKATIEITSRYQGSIVKLHHGQGDIVKVGATLVDIQVATGPDTQTAAGAGSSPAPPPAPAAASAPSPSSPAGANILTTQEPAAAAAAAAAGPPSADLEPPPQAPAAAGTAARAIRSGSGSGSDAVLSSPAVRHLAREHGVSLVEVQATGRDGRVLREDVLRYVELHQGGRPPLSAPAPAAPAAAAAAVVPQGPGAAGAGAGATKVVPLRGFRRAMVKTMTAVASIPHFHYTDEVCVDALMAIRSALADDPSLAGAKLTLLPLAIKALSCALLLHPTVNASLSPSGSDLLIHSDHNIGVAMAAPGGLVVPNIKQVQTLSVPEVAIELRRLQSLAAANQLLAADVAGGTISISNIGSIGGIHASPLVNPPEVAIVALGRVRRLPRFDGAGQVVARSLLPISWGADHRVLDGAGLAQLSNTWKQLLEDPTRLLLQLR